MAEANEPTNRVFVGNLPWSVTDEELAAHFEQAGGVVNAEVQVNPTGRSKGWGLVTFVGESEAANAISMLHNTDMSDRRINVREDRGATRKPRQTPQYTEPLAGGMTEPRVFFGNLPWSYTNESLGELLADFNYTSAEVQMGRNGRSRGYALVTFGGMDDANRAIGQLNGTIVGGEGSERELLVREDRD